MYLVLVSPCIINIKQKIGFPLDLTCTSSAVCTLACALLLAVYNLPPSSTMSLTPSFETCDAHLHVWTDDYPYVKPPPSALAGSVASFENLLATMDTNGVSRSVIVQPSNYAFDHTYVLQAMSRHPERLAVVLLLDPTLSPTEASKFIRDMVKRGCTGIRFNPSLFPEGRLDTDTGRAAFRTASELGGIPISVMAFTGLRNVADSITLLANEFSNVPLILDHFGFPREKPAESPSKELQFDEESFALLLRMGSDLSTLHVKISALFRVSSLAVS